MIVLEHLFSIVQRWEDVSMDYAFLSEEGSSIDFVRENLCCE